MSSLRATLALPLARLSLKDRLSAPRSKPWSDRILSLRRDPERLERLIIIGVSWKVAQAHFPARRQCHRVHTLF